MHDTVTSEYRFYFRIRGSRFHGFLTPATSKSEALNVFSKIQSEHPGATHYCYAYIAEPENPLEFAHDGGEPAGTAGLPILNSMRSCNIMNAILTVVRYYGGSKLGKSGLIDAYRETALGTIKQAKLNELIPFNTFRIEYQYARQGFIDKMKHDFTITEIDAAYHEYVELTIGCSLSDSEKFEDFLSANKHILNKFQNTGISWFIKKRN